MLGSVLPHVSRDASIVRSKCRSVTLLLCLQIALTIAILPNSTAETTAKEINWKPAKEILAAMKSTGMLPEYDTYAAKQGEFIRAICDGLEKEFELPGKLCNKTVRRIHDKPLSTVEECSAYSAPYEKLNPVPESLMTIIETYANLLDSPVTAEPFAPIVAATGEELIEQLFERLLKVKEMRDKAFASLSNQDFSYMSLHLSDPLFRFTEPAVSNITQQQITQEISSVRFIHKIDFAALYSSAKMFASIATSTNIELCKKLLPEMLGKEEICQFTKEDLTIIIGGTGSNKYGKLPTLLIELGGNDEYESALYPWLSMVIDIAGNDKYKGSAIASGLFGCGFVYDLAGNDTYSALRKSVGYGECGVGALVDFAGNDTYAVEEYGCGTGYFGMGMIVDFSGNDLYTATRNSIGCGMTMGIGAILDYSGKDEYLAAQQLDKAMDPDPRCIGAGVGWYIHGNKIGLPGGVGVVADYSGDDTYHGSGFSVAFGYQLGIGLIHDFSGNDTYREHFAGEKPVNKEKMIERGSTLSGLCYSLLRGIACLIDEKGSDKYICYKIHSMCNASGKSIAVLYDAHGNDLYDTISYTLAYSNNSSFSLFIDADGKDKYDAKNDAMAYGYNDPDAGSGRPVPQPASIAMFFDLGSATDTYSEFKPFDMTNYRPRDNKTSFMQTSGSKERGFTHCLFHDK